MHRWCGIVPTDSNQMEVTTVTPSGLRRDTQTLALVAFVGLSAVLFVACSSSDETPVESPQAAQAAQPLVAANQAVTSGSGIVGGDPISRTTR